jgi:hypothetical protein
MPLHLDAPLHGVVCFGQVALPCHVGAAVTLQLDAATDDVYSVDIRAPSFPNEAFDYTQVWLSPTPNYTAGTLCGRGVCFLEGQQDTAAVPGAVLCPPASNTRYVTIAKPLYSNPYWVPNGDQLALDEVQVNLGGGWVGSTRGNRHPAVRVCFSIFVPPPPVLLARSAAVATRGRTHEAHATNMSALH